MPHLKHPINSAVAFTDAHKLRCLYPDTLKKNDAPDRGSTVNDIKNAVLIQQENKTAHIPQWRRYRAKFPIDSGFLWVVYHNNSDKSIFNLQFVFIAECKNVNQKNACQTMRDVLFS